MVNISCGTDSSCPYSYECIDNLCQHTQIFPISGIEIAVFCFFPFASAICNTSGNSFGEFKVLLLMDILNYSQERATILCYPLVLGTALYNVIRLIFKRHPYKSTSIVDYNLVMIIIPNVLYGSTIGSLVNNLMPNILADSLIICLLVAFSIKFFFKLKTLIQTAKEHELKRESHNLDDNKQVSINEQKKSNLAQHLLNQEQRDLVANNLPTILQIGLLQHDNGDRIQVQSTDTTNIFSKELQQQLKYEQTHHWPHILSILVLFIIFQALAFLAQGKIIKFSLCSQYYGIGIGMLTLVYIGVVFAINYVTKRKIKHYKAIGFQYQYPLDKLKYFLLICAGSFLGGFNGGAFAIGNSVTIILTLIYLDVEQIVVSATVGFQVAFASSASLCQALATDKIELNVVGLFFSITFLGGGLLSYLLGRFVDKMNRDKVNIFLVGIVICLTCTSSISMVINVVLGYLNFGSDYMNSADGLC